MQQTPFGSKGFTLVELMIVVAILAIITAIAIPAYNGYIREARLGTAKANMETLRIFLEDTKLEDGSYVPGGGNGPTIYNASSTPTINNAYNWSPDGDQGQYSYQVTASSNSYDIVVTHTSGIWFRCDDRMTDCCDGTGTVSGSCS